MVDKGRNGGWSRGSREGGWGKGGAGVEDRGQIEDGDGVREISIWGAGVVERG